MGTTQNDIIKEYLSRGTYVFPPEASMRLISDIVAYTVEAIPKWNPINICSYHLQEAGSDAGPGDRLLDGERHGGARRGARAGRRARRGDRPGLRAHLLLPERGHPLHRRDLQVPGDDGALGGARASSATASTTPKMLRFRYGVQVNSLGLTEAQPENNIVRIALEALGVTLSKNARARARCSCRPGTRPWACRAPGISSGRCASSRSSPTRRICSSTRTSSTAPTWSRPAPASWWRPPGRSSRRCSTWGAPWRPSRTPT